jgi:hypothetical protein
MTSYEAVNDGSPEIRLGSADADELHIQTVYDTGAQTLDYVLLQTDSANAGVNKGLFRFNVDGSNILDIDDGGIDLDTGGAISVNGTDVLSATALGSGVTSSSLTSVGTVSTGTWASTVSGATIDGDNNTISNLDIGNEVDWAVISDVADISAAFTTGDKILIFEAGVGMRKVDYDDLPGAGGGLSNIVEDTTPQLGGMLDVNGNAIGDGTLELLTFTEDISAVNHVNIENEATGNGPIIRSAGDDTNINLEFQAKGSGIFNFDSNIDVTGNIVVSGTVDGRDVATDGTKLDGIETAADVTDVTNVTAAGALMDSELTDITAVKALSDASIADTNTGTSTTAFVTPDGLQGSIRNLRFVDFVLVAPDTDCAVDTDIYEWECPFACTIIQDDSNVGYFSAWTDTAGTTGTMVVDIHLNGTTIMTTNKLDIENAETSTRTAATQPDLTTTDVAAGDKFVFAIDAIHSGTAAKGLTVRLALRPD